MSVKKDTADTSKAEDQEDESTTEEDTEETDEATKESTEEEDDSENSDKEEDEERDLDAEIEAEKKAGKPDPEKAQKAFKERKEKHKDEDDEDEDEEDGDKPLTRKDLNKVKQDVRQEFLESQALEIAKQFTDSPKEAELIVLKWKNRQFPVNQPLSDQIEDMYVITHKKKILGTKNEALRALHNRNGVNKSGTGSHREGMKRTTIKTPTHEMQAYIQTGYVVDPKNPEKLTKKLPNGDTLELDLKNKTNRYVKKSK